MTTSSICQLFPNGKLLVIGGKTRNETKQMFDLYVQKLLEIGHPIEYMDYKNQNIVACYKHQNEIDLNEVSRKYGFEYTKGIFPAEQHRDEIRNVGGNIFSCVKLGAKSVAT